MCIWKQAISQIVPNLKVKLFNLEYFDLPVVNAKTILNDAYLVCAIMRIWKQVISQIVPNLNS